MVMTTDVPKMWPSVPWGRSSPGESGRFPVVNSGLQLGLAF